MRFRKHIVVVVAVTVFTALAITALASFWAGMASSARPQTQEKTRRDDLPVTDLATSDRSNQEQARRAKSSRRNSASDKETAARFMINESYPEESYDLSLSHSPEPLALPAGQSDLVMIGEVVDRQAFLSADKTSIYSAFTVRVEEILKNTSPQTVFINSKISLERYGGAVRFPSGKVIRRGKIMERMPLADKRYVFFLRNQEGVESFDILTGYELRDGKVFPLDGVDRFPGGVKLPQFAIYEGVEEQSFLNKVREALIHPPEPLPLQGLSSIDNQRRSNRDEGFPLPSPSGNLSHLRWPDKRFTTE